MLPQLDKPQILDIGCGSGFPTMELARLSNGEIIGIDIDQHSLDRLTRRIEQAGFSDRVIGIRSPDPHYKGNTPRGRDEYVYD